MGSSTTDTGGLQQFAVIWEDGERDAAAPDLRGPVEHRHYIHNDGSIAGSMHVPGPVGFIRRAVIWRNGEVDLVLGTLADGTPEEPLRLELR